MSAGVRTLVILLALPGVYYLALGRSRIDEIGRLQRAVRTAGEALPQHELHVARLQELTEDREHAQARASSLRDRLEPQPVESPLILDASVSLRSFGLASNNVEIVKPEIREGFESERVKLVILGAFPDLVKFIRHIENSVPPCRVVDLNVRSVQRGQIRAELSIERFWRRAS